jgi:3-oxoacyl-[acyl-carrier-protein] synthase-3
MDLYMDGLAVFNFTLQRVGTLVRETLALHGWEPEQVGAFLFHQANAFMLNSLAKKLKLPAGRVSLNIGKYGNTSIASIPLLMADDFGGLLQEDQPQNLLLAAFGIGYSWAAVAATLSGIRTAKVISTEATAECSIHSTSAAS